MTSASSSNNTPSQVIVIALGLVMMALATGCPSEPAEATIYLQRMTATPVTTTVNVTHQREPDLRTITISEGVGVGLSCSEHCPGQQRHCEDAVVTVTPPELATISEAFLLDGRQGAVVLVADKVGSGTVAVKSSCAEATYRLDVLAR